MFKNYLPLLEADGNASGHADGDLTPEQTSFLGDMGLLSESEEEPQETSDTEEPEEDSATEEPDESLEEEASEEEQPLPGTGKANKAFAELRTQNAALKSFIDKLSKGLKLPSGQGLEEQLNQLQNVVLQVQAKQTGVPVEFVQRLEALERENFNLRAQDIDIHNRESFSRLTKEYELTEEEIEKFKDDLADKGFSYLDEKINLDMVFRDFYSASLIERAVEKRLSQESARVKKVEEHSTEVTDVSGESEKDSEEKKINSVSELNQLFGRLSR